MRDETVLLGANVYCWAQAAQNRLLLECLAPAVREIRDQLGPLRFWFDRFDARGPHVISLLTLPAGAETGARQLLAARIESFFSAYPERGTLPRESVEKRHESCRGKIFCDLDREPGIAPEGTYRLFAHSPEGFPYRLTRGLPCASAEAVWDLVDDLTSWTLREIAANPERGAPQVAALWLARLEQELRNAHPRPEEYWRFHATTLLRGLSRRLEEDEEGVLAGLPDTINRHNAETLPAVWQQAAAGPARWPRVTELLRRAAPAGEPAHPGDWRLLREIVHWTLKQLCLYVETEIPLVLYAWQRNLRISS